MRALAMTALAAIILAVTPLSAAAGAGVQIKDDKFSAEATFVGPRQFVNPLGGTSRLWFIRSWLNKSNHGVRHQLYVDTGYMWHWRFWNIAADDQATPHPVDKIESEVNSCSSMVCSYTEVVGIDFDDAYMRAKAETGFQVKLSAQSGDDLVLSVTPQQIQPVIAAIDAYSATNPAAYSANPVGGSVLGVKGVMSPRGFLVLIVMPGSVAEKAGLRPGDVMTTIGQRPVADLGEMQRSISATAPGSAVPASLLRGSAPVSVSFQF